MNCKMNNWFCFLSISFVTNFFLVSLIFAQETIFFKEEHLLSEHQKTLPILSRQQHLKCLEKIKLAEKNTKQLNKQKNMIDNNKKYLDEIKYKLEAKKNTLDLHSPESVLAYNQLNKKLKQLSIDYNLDAEYYNNAVKQYHSEIIMLKNECNNKRLRKQ